ncbi:hypothetical protein C8J57DRAFT_1530509 [Mycena rebaudengoi]|nr:hypothetical protein C8J57DRAFT_1530509 [Mycena rebaudengoi]
MSVNTDCEDKSNEFYSDDDHMEVDDPNEPRSHPTDNDLPPAYYNILSPEMPTPEHEDDDEFENESEGWSRFDEVLDADAPLSLTEEVTKLEEMIGPEGEAELLAMPLREREGENIQEEKIPEEIKAAKAKATEAAPPRFRKPNNDKLKIRLPAPGPIPPTQFKTLEAFTPRRLFLQDKIVANAIWRFLELRGFLLNTYRHSPLARAMYAAVKHAKMRFSCRSLPPSSLSLPASCSPPPPSPTTSTPLPLTYTPAQVNDKLQDQCLELVRADMMHGHLWSGHAFSGEPQL